MVENFQPVIFVESGGENGIKGGRTSPKIMAEPHLQARGSCQK